MGTIIDEIANAISSLGLSDHDIVRLENEKGERIFNDCYQHFVKSEGRRWWWEDFRQPSVSFNLDQAYLYLDRLMPENVERIWLIAEDDKAPFYAVYDAKPCVVGQIIGECIGFEYYVIDKNKLWLLCENHHGRLIGVGQSIRPLM